MYLALLYDLVDDYLERRPQFRGEHLRLAEEAAARGELVLAGALSDPADSALLIFKGNDRAVAEKFARADPYVQNHLVRSWQVREWKVVVGCARTPGE